MRPQCHLQGCTVHQIGRGYMKLNVHAEELPVCRRMMPLAVYMVTVSFHPAKLEPLPIYLMQYFIDLGLVFYQMIFDDIPAPPSPFCPKHRLYVLVRITLTRRF